MMHNNESNEYINQEVFDNVHKSFTSVINGGAGIYKVIAVDFDGTLCKNEWPGIGEANDTLFRYLRINQARGAKLILWTCRSGELLENAIEWCRERNLIFDAVNENIPEAVKQFGNDSRKIFAHEYIDDSANRYFARPYEGRATYE